MDEKERSHIDQTFAVLAEVAREERELAERVSQGTEPPGVGW
jgi:hypothetical protein